MGAVMTRREGGIIKQPEIQGWESLGKVEEQWSEGGMRTQGGHLPPAFSRSFGVRAVGQK